MRRVNGSTGQERAIYKGDDKPGFLWAGQCIGGIRDISTVAELIQCIVAEAEATLISVRENAVSP